jgi:hypothetical protein
MKSTIGHDLISVGRAARSPLLVVPYILLAKLPSVEAVRFAIAPKADEYEGGAPGFILDWVAPPICSELHTRVLKAFSDFV